jgi:hypothetical protein
MHRGDDAFGLALAGGTANTFVGGSAMGFDDLASAGGLGSGSATGSANSSTDSNSKPTYANGAATGTFTQRQWF